MMDFGPICSLCTRDWDERLGYCEYCEGDKPVKKAKKAKKSKRKIEKFKQLLLDPFFFIQPDSDTPIYDQLTIDAGFAPDQSADWHYMPGGAGLLEDNFS